MNATRGAWGWWWAGLAWQIVCGFCLCCKSNWHFDTFVVLFVLAVSALLLHSFDLHLEAPICVLGEALPVWLQMGLELETVGGWGRSICILCCSFVLDFLWPSVLQPRPWLKLIIFTPARKEEKKQHSIFLQLSLFRIINYGECSFKHSSQVVKMV